ncbi:MAG: TetR family transcriptional regulator [Massilia sp.]
MRKTRQQTALTRSRIIAVASSEFRKRGVAASGIAKVMSAAGMTQGGFYRHFASKDQLVMEAMRAAFADLAARFRACAAADRPPEQSLRLVVQVFLQQLHGDEASAWCPLAVLGSELHHCSVEVRAIAARGYVALLELIAALLRRMGRADAVCLAEAIVNTLIGAVSLARLVPERASAEAILENAGLAVEALLDNEATRHR